MKLTLTLIASIFLQIQIIFLCINVEKGIRQNRKRLEDFIDQWQKTVNFIGVSAPKGENFSGQQNILKEATAVKGEKEG